MKGKEHPPTSPISPRPSALTSTRSTPLKVRLLPLLLLAGLLEGGCSFWPFDSEPSQPTPAPAVGKPAPPTTPTTSKGESVADRRLQRIIERQDAFLRELSTNPEGFSMGEQERQANAILSEYQSFILDNPDNVYAHLLYGKLLRQLGDREAANLIFLKTNRINPNLAVVKQQIGNFLAEEGQPELALPYFLAAVQLEPNEAIYHYQLGELLYRYRDDFTASGGYDRATLDREMLAAFRNAARLAPNDRNLQQRYAEAFFDLEQPDWNQALQEWDRLLKTASTPHEIDLIRLQKARVLIQLGRYDEARSLLISVDRPALEDVRQQLLRQTTTSP